MRLSRGADLRVLGFRAETYVPIPEPIWEATLFRGVASGWVGRKDPSVRRNAPMEGGAWRWHPSRDGGCMGGVADIEAPGSERRRACRTNKNTQDTRKTKGNVGYKGVVGCKDVRANRYFCIR